MPLSESPIRLIDEMVSALIPTAAGLGGYEEQPVEAEAALNRLFDGGNTGKLLVRVS